jgi:hypothetical protein
VNERPKKPLIEAPAEAKIDPAGLVRRGSSLTLEGAVSRSMLSFFFFQRQNRAQERRKGDCLKTLAGLAL